MKLILIMLLGCSLIFGQVVYLPINVSEIDTTEKYVIDNVPINTDTISAEELFLQDIAEQALAKEAKRKELTNDFLMIAVIYLLIDKFFIE